MDIPQVIHDVLIIGGGPAGLAVAARLRESTPSAVFSDAEHSRYQWIKKHAERTNIHRPKAHHAKGAKHTSTSHFGSASNKSTSSKDKALDIKVLDASGPNWMHTWKHNFSALRISHLRSPMFFHPCPRDRDGLLAFAHETGRSDTCLEIGGCVGKSMSKHRRKKKIARGCGVGKESAKAPLEIDERDRKDYFNPTTDLFHAYCDSIVGRYGLGKLIENKKVMSIEFDCLNPSNLDHERRTQESPPIFKVVTACGAVMFSKMVVLAIGSGGSPIMPRPLSTAEHEGACHSTQIRKGQFLPSNVMRKLQARRPTAVVVVGGGLTAAQIAINCLESGVSRVFMVMRSALKVKPFNIDLAWVAKYRNGEKAAFWSADSDEERYEMIQKARDGGSMTARFYRKLEPFISKKTLSIHPHTTISTQSFSPTSHTWTLTTSPPTPALSPPTQIDYIYYATGLSTNISTLPFLSAIRETYPIEIKCGLPCLTNELAWREDVPLFLIGRLAALRVGPDCETLEGARLGAERVSWAVQERMEREGDAGDGGGGGDEQGKYCEMCERIGAGNMYECLDGDGGEED